MKILSRITMFGTSLLLSTPCLAQTAAPPPALNSGDTSWMMLSAILVLMMSIPGLALFYGGLVKKDNVLATLMQTFAVCCLVSVLWPLIGYTLVFTEGNALIGGLSHFLMRGVGVGTVMPLAPTIPESVYIMFQLTFAVITAAILLGSVADRIKFSAVFLFAPLWMIFAYCPIAHWIWGPGGFLGGVGDATYAGFLGLGKAIDFAGGTVVHINAGIAGLVAALVIGRKHTDGAVTPYNLVFSVIGASLLWVGWFGFNAGSAITAGSNAGMAMLVTNSATAIAGISWMLIEWWHKGKPSVIGAICGAVAGLVAITPAAGFVGFAYSLIFGVVASICCYGAVNILKTKCKYDDSLDVFGVHGVGGIVGAILLGIFAEKAVGGTSGALEGNYLQIASQLVCVGITILYSAIVTYILLKLVDKTVGLRVDLATEITGLDLSLHGEQAHH
jgi:ammonium transporter, Amt family